MLVKIHQNQVHHLIETILDDGGTPTGEERDVLQFDFRFPEYPDLPTYGMTLYFPIDAQKVKDAIVAKACEVKALMERDIAIRKQLGEVFEFNIEV